MVFKIYKTGTPSARCGRKPGFCGCRRRQYYILQIYPYYAWFRNYGNRRTIDVHQFIRQLRRQQLLDQRIWMDLHCTCHFCELEYVICNIGDIYLRSFQYAAGIRRFSLRYVPLCTGMAEKNPGAIYAGATVPYYGGGTCDIFC